MFGRQAIGRRPMERRFFLPTNGGYICVAQPSRRLNQRIEHFLQLEGRAADHLEYVASSSLLLEGVSKLLSCLVPLAGPLVELLLDVGGGRIETAHSSRHLAVLGLRLREPRFHSCAAPAQQSTGRAAAAPPSS